MSPRIAVALGLLTVITPLRAAEPMQPVIFFALDTDYNYNSGYGLGVVGAMIDTAGDKRTGKQAAGLQEALGFDLLAAAMPELTCDATTRGTQACATVTLAVQDEKTLLAALSERNLSEGRIVRYLAMVNDAELWSRLTVQVVKRKKNGVQISRPVAGAYYVQRLTDEEIALAGQPWRAGAPTRLQQEVRASWPELRDLWLRIESDSSANDSNPQKGWKALPKVPKEQDGWTFNCRGMVGCSGQHIAKLTDSRVWITAGGGPVLTSLNKSQAAFASNIMAITIR
jgi:hypothetical protein